MINLQICGQKLGSWDSLYRHNSTRENTTYKLTYSAIANISFPITIYLAIFVLTSVIEDYIQPVNSIVHKKLVNSLLELDTCYVKFCSFAQFNYINNGYVTQSTKCRTFGICLMTLIIRKRCILFTDEGVPLLAWTNFNPNKHKLLQVRCGTNYLLKSIHVTRAPGLADKLFFYPTPEDYAKYLWGLLYFWYLLGL